MTLNESIVEDTALEWSGKLGYAAGDGPQLATGEPAAERDSFARWGNSALLKPSLAPSQWADHDPQVAGGGA